MLLELLRVLARITLCFEITLFCNSEVGEMRKGDYMIHVSN